MKKLFTFLSLLSFTFQFFSQYQVGHTTLTFNDPSRTGGYGSGGGTGRQIQTEVYYPAASSGDNVAVSSGQFPVITFGHGFAMSWDAYTNIWQHYAAKGYILAFPRTEGGLIPGPSHGDFGSDLKLVADKMLVLNTNSSSIFLGKIKQKVILMGHSMGGGATFLGAASNTNIAGVVGLAPAETTPSAIAAAPNVSVPALIFSGSADGVTPPADNHVPIYQGLTSTCKNFSSILGGGHCYYANTNFNCDFGESTSSPNISITREAQQTAMYAILDPWLDFILNDNCEAYNAFQTAMTNTTGTQNQSTCPAAQTVSINANNAVLTASTTGTSYQWFLDGNPISGATAQNFTATQTGNYTVKVTFAYGCTTSAPYTYSTSTTGLEELKNQIYIYPNPTKDVLNLNNINGLTLRIQLKDMSGRTILIKEDKATKISLDIQAITNGNYILVIESPIGNLTQKLIKE